ncbi:hypothetical protein MD484_g5802, partial [Candolleomyces efflorescens]
MLHAGYSGNYIVLFDWSQANGRAKNEGIQRWYNGPTLLALDMHFLPEGRILAVVLRPDCHIEIFNWKSDWRHSTTATETDFQEHLPSWWRDFRGTHLASMTHSPPMVIGDSIRFVVPTAGAIWGMTVPISASKDIRVDSLAEGSPGTAFGPLHNFGCRRGVSIDSSTLQYYALDYEWSNEEEEPTPNAQSMTIPCSPISHFYGQLFFDPYSNRIVISESSFERMFFIQVYTVQSSLSYMD